MHVMVSPVVTKMPGFDREKSEKRVEATAITDRSGMWYYGDSEGGGLLLRL